MAQIKNDIRSKVLKGVVWKFSERILAQVASLIVTIVIARLLDPADYGVVSIVTVFFSFANVIISGGLNTALIQKKEKDIEDYNTVFSVSFVISLVIYVCLFVAAPWIAEIYNRDILISIVRVMGVSLPIYALKSIVCAYISSNLQFKMFFFATLGGTLVSAIVGIFIAVKGYGPWALVAQQITNTVIDTLILFIITKLRLSFRISLKKYYSLFGYGSKIMIASLLGVTISQINPLFIGLKYTTADLSFYTKGRAIPETLSSSMSYTISSVFFPALSKFQNDKDSLHKYTRLYMQVASFIVFPVMLGFAGISDDFVRVLLGEKWMPASYYIKITCFATMFDIVAVGNCESIKAMGRSDVYLKMEVIKKSGYFVTLILFLIFSCTPKGLALSIIVCTIIQIIVNSIPNRSLINYRTKEQLGDLIPNLLISIIMYIIVKAIGLIKIHALLLLVIQIIAGSFVYFSFAYITHNRSLRLLMNLIRRR